MRTMKTLAYMFVSKLEELNSSLCSSEIIINL